MNIRDLNIKLSGIDENGQEHEYSVSDFCRKETILYFYPKDNTSGCTQEACDFKENKNRWSHNAQVVAVSPDSIKSHKSFQEKQGLNFIILSDPEHTLSKAFDVWGEKSMYGRKYMGIIRSTFLINKDGEITNEWRKVKVKGHVDEVLKALEK